MTTGLDSGMEGEPGAGDGPGRGPSSRSMASRREARESRRPGRRILRDPTDDTGVSNVLGAVLMFGILVITLITIRVEYVPVWDEDRQARHMEQVFGQLAVLKSDLDRLVDNRSDVAITDPIALGKAGGFNFFRGATLGGSLTFQSASAAVAVSSPRLTILESNGRSFYGLPGPLGWKAIPATGDVLSDVVDVRALRVRISMDQVSGPANGYKEGDSTTLLISNSTGAYAGRAVITFHKSPSENSLETVTYDSVGDEVSRNVEAFFQNTDLSYLYIDLLDPALLVDALLAGAGFPLTLSLQENGLDASYIVVYDAAAGGSGTRLVGGSGITITPYGPELYPGGTLTYSARNPAFVDQTYVVEHGAIIRVQDQGSALVVAPLLLVAKVGTVAVVDWTVPSLTGASQTLTGPHQAGVVADPSGARERLRATTYELSLTVPTAYPTVWAGYLTREMDRAGFTSPTEFTVTVDSAGSSVLLQVFGPTAASTTDDIEFTFNQSEIAIELSTSG